MSSASASAARVVSTIVIWSLFTTIMGFVTLGGNVRQVDMIWIVSMLAVAAMYSTRVVWRGSGGEASQAQFNGQSIEKVKRNAKERLARTLNALDDEEAAALLEDFKSRLAGGDSDGEISAVDMLRQERRQRT
ncbi:MAG: hypothetical protein KF716_24265 [Anaerolineae bacterium]|nr:hypothetical protein [Anaerolineae bacterium]